MGRVPLVCIVPHGVAVLSRSRERRGGTSFSAPARPALRWGLSCCWAPLDAGGVLGEWLGPAPLPTAVGRTVPVGSELSVGGDAESESPRCGLRSKLAG